MVYLVHSGAQGDVDLSHIYHFQMQRVAIMIIIEIMIIIITITIIIMMIIIIVTHIIIIMIIQKRGVPGPWLLLATYRPPVIVRHSFIFFLVLLQSIHPTRTFIAPPLCINFVLYFILFRFVLFSFRYKKIPKSLRREPAFRRLVRGPYGLN